MPRSASATVTMCAMVLRAVVLSVQSARSFAFLNVYNHSGNYSRRSFSAIVGKHSSKDSSQFESRISLKSVTVVEENVKDDKRSSETMKSRILADNDVYEKIKASLDKRKYRLIELNENKLQILLVSDSETDTEAAAVHVKAGHFDDPDDRAGLAHFHEHMVFLGR